MESRWYLAHGQTLENTKISDREHALHVTASAWKGLTSHLDRNRIIAETLEKERTYKKALKEGSEAMIKDWPDSIERSHTRKQEERKRRMQAMESDKIQKYMELRKEQDDMKQAYIEKVKKSMYFSKAYPKMLNGALLESEAIYEREKQIEFSKMIKEHEMEEERKYAERIKQAAEEEVRENKEKELKNWEIKQELKATYLKDMEEKKEFIKMQRETRKMKQLADNENATKEIELQQKMKHEDMLKVREKKKRELLDYIKLDNSIKAHIQKEEAEVDEVIKIFDEAKQYISCLRKAKDEEIINEQIEFRSRAGKFMESEQKTRDEEYARMLKKAQDDIAQQEEERRLEKLEKQKQIRIEREADRRQFIERQEKEKQNEKELKKWQLLNRQKQANVTEEVDKEKKQRDWEKTLHYRQELLDQIEEQKVRNVTDEDGDAKTAEFLKNKLEQKDKRFFDYADQVLDYCDKKGRPTKPIMRVIREYKRQNLLENVPEQYCDPVDIYENRREKMVNTTPGKMRHNPRSDPNYNRCRCHQNKIFK